MKLLIRDILLRRASLLIPLLIAIAGTAATMNSPAGRIFVSLLGCGAMGGWVAFEFVLDGAYRRTLLLLPFSRKELALALWGTGAVLMPLIGLILGCLILPLPYLNPPGSPGPAPEGFLLWLLYFGGLFWLMLSTLPIQESALTSPADPPAACFVPLFATFLLFGALGASLFCTEEYVLPRSPKAAQMVFGLLASCCLASWIASYWTFKRFQVESSRYVPKYEGAAQARGKRLGKARRIVFSGPHRPLLRRTLQTIGETLPLMATAGVIVYLLLVVIQHAQTGQWRFWVTVPFTADNHEAFAAFCFFAALLAFAGSQSEHLFGWGFRAFRTLPVSRTRLVLWMIGSGVLFYCIVGGALLALFGLMVPSPSFLLVPFISCGAAGIACGMLSGVLAMWFGSMLWAHVAVTGVSYCGLLYMFRDPAMAEAFTRFAQNGSLLIAGILVATLCVPVLSRILDRRARISIGLTQG